MKIKIEDLIESGWFLDGIGKDKVKVYYKNKRGSNPKPFILPKNIEIDEFAAECIGLYLGDGKLSPDIRHCDFTNKDIDLVCKMLKFFTYLGVKTKDITFTIDYTHGDIEKIVKETSRILGKQKFRLNKTERNKFPAVHIQVTGTIFRRFLENFIKKSLILIENESNRRKAWLRGYFAAEGCVGYHSKENYLANISFSYNPKKEVWLRDYCLKLLKLEGIYSNIKIRFEEKNGAIMIINWKNYYKLWKIGLFDGCERKKRQFEKIIKRVKICCNLNEDFRRSLFSDINQYELADALGTYQATISNMVNGNKNMWPTVEQLTKLSKIKKLSVDDIKRNIKSVRFGNLTEMELNKELLDDIFNR